MLFVDRHTIIEINYSKIQMDYSCFVMEYCSIYS